MNPCQRQRPTARMDWKAGAAVLTSAIGALALAGPPTGVSYVNYTLLIDPDAADRLQINLPEASGYEEDVATGHGTRSPAVFVFQDFTMYPDANTGWHYHPGIVLITVAQGSVDWYDARCTKRTHTAGDFFTEGNQLHFVRNSSSSPARLIITFVIEKGVTNKIFAPPPPCAAALGLR